MTTQPLKVLCVEDSNADYLLIQRALKQSGMMDTCVRVDTHEALTEALAQGQWDVVLSDYSVPGMYFIQTLGLLQRRFPNLPLILVSGTVGEIKAAALVELGAWGSVSKNNLGRLPLVIEEAMRAGKEGRARYHSPPEDPDV